MAKSNQARKSPQQRYFGVGQPVKVKRKSWVVDREREGEGSKPGVLPPIEQDMTGVEGVVCSDPYESPEKGMCVPLQLENGAVISVPEERIEKSHPGSSRAGYTPAWGAAWDRASKPTKGKRKN